MNEQAHTVLQDLKSNKEADLAPAMELALADGTFLQALCDGLTSQDEVWRYNCYQVLVQVALEHPARLYPAWDQIVALLDSQNAYHRSVAVRLLAYLTPADAQGRFAALFDRYYRFLDDPKILVTRYLVQDSGVIACAKPGLQAQIVDQLMSIGQTHHKHKDLIKGDVLQAFEAFFESYPDQAQMLAFARDLLEAESPKTRKAAKAFLKRWG